MGNPEILLEDCIILPDKRQLGFCAYGTSHGAPVYFFHGFPGSRIQAALVADMARENNLCLVAADRPGFGKSSHDDDRTISGFSDDIRELADYLGHQRFGVLGVSCGGPYALACALRLNDRISHIGLMAGIGPLDMPLINSTQLPILKMMFSLARIHPKLLTPLLLLDSYMFRRNPPAAVMALSKMLTSPDQVFLKSNPELALVFGNSLAEAYRQGIQGALKEVCLIASPRDFSMAAIRQPADVYQGAFDRHVPPAMGRYIADTLPNAEYHHYENEGHMSILRNAFSEYGKKFNYWHKTSGAIS